MSKKTFCQNAFVLPSNEKCQSQGRLGKTVLENLVSFISSRVVAARVEGGEGGGKKVNGAD